MKQATAGRVRRHPGARMIQMLLVMLLVGGCETAYYGAMEKIGFHKRDIMVDRVEDAMESQQEAQEEFQNAYERFSSVVSVPASDLEKTYRRLNDAFERAEAKAAEVTERVDRVESVSEALFVEWREEIEEIGDGALRASSSRQLKDSQAQYQTLIKAMRRAESRMDPVLGTFRDYVLYLKHNLNAQAIASLRGELSGVEADVSELIRDMEASIAQAREFISQMD